MLELALSRGSWFPGILSKAKKSFLNFFVPVQKHSPLRELLQDKIGHLNDVGLTGKWLKDSVNSYGR